VNYREAQLIMEMVADTGLHGLARPGRGQSRAGQAQRRRRELAVDLVESLFGKSTLMRD
jgi:arginase